MPSTDRVPTPGDLFKAFFSYQMTEVLRTAIELDLFTAIGRE